MTVIRTEVSNPEYSEQDVTTLTVHSSHIKRRQDVSVYDSSNGDKADLPIIILLHGVYGSNLVWMQLGGVHKVYEQLKAEGLNDFVLVMPSDGGLWDGSGYLPLKDEGDFEQWIVDDVLTGVKDNINSVSKQSNVYISGLSMGGYGALRLGAKYPALFKGISAHSSVTNLTDLQQFIANPVSDYKCENEHESDIRYWAEKNLTALPPIRLDCGRDDPLFESNLKLVKQFDKIGVKYDFYEYSGAHEWSYWNEHIKDTFKFFNSLEVEKAPKSSIGN